jgi:hypothetical protein
VALDLTVQLSTIYYLCFIIIIIMCKVNGAPGGCITPCKRVLVP